MPLYFILKLSLLRCWFSLMFRCLAVHEVCSLENGDAFVSAIFNRLLINLLILILYKYDVWCDHTLFRRQLEVRFLLAKHALGQTLHHTWKGVKTMGRLTLVGVVGYK